jgi:predicted PurR-regulated permease PerM
VRVIERIEPAKGIRLPRGVASALVMIALVAVTVWGVALAVPRIAAEAARFAVHAPEVIARVLEDVQAAGAARGMEPWLGPAIAGLRQDMHGALGNLGGPLTQGAATVFGGLGQLLGVALLPLLAFYLLAESEAVLVSALCFVPEASRADIARLGGAVDRALRSYVRGQAIVCLVTGVAVGAGLALIHHPVALLLGLLAGAAELIPYIGYMVAVSAIAIAGSSDGMLQAVLGVALYSGLNWTIGTFVTPRLMGRYLRMHPFVITVSVLAGAKLLGAEGALLALPVAAVIRALVGELAAPPRAGERCAVAVTSATPGPDPKLASILR